ncbi:WbqC family protein [Polaribacter litorisediminis]|uniref:WbqC family protein n=1 Tax=Polaribacter litorisediminis TaxID=1908341 RepID=UPI001CBF0C11|nr:WbqC family protein [Polaribacter litorisediminis]UAM98797.1 WbqC family protein [Polaribacter litorisediminis]
MALFIPTYFSPISQYSEIVKSDTVVFEMEDNFQKQSYRNRCYIYNSNGKQLLSIPVKHPLKSARKKTKDTLIENDFPWQDQHFKSLQIAYRTSPFFDLLEDDIAPIFEKKYKYLQDINIDSYLFITDALQLNSDFSKTDNYKLETQKNDYRFLADRKHQPKKTTEKYIQMFDDKHGFIENLSILDLLFMEGPNALSFL